jgi:NDP-sugar pyrophosphorylase family protein
MQVIVPMSGRGQRFLDAGFADVKPLIPMDGYPMVEHVVRCFPGVTDFLFICARDHLETTPLRHELERIAPGSPIVAIEPHKKGPVHAALMAADYVKDDVPVMLNYCDFSVGWDFKNFRKTMAELNPAGCITAYRGFHPHTLGPNLYAYMRQKDNWMREIREKYAFTDDRMNEFASSGAYYFGSGALLKKYFRRAVERNLAHTNGEYYSSTPYNLLVEDGLPVYIYELTHFLQWGTPEDVHEYNAWSDYFAHWAAWKPSLPPRPGVNLLPMVGAGVRFQRQGYQEPKPLVPVAGVSMVQRSLDTLPAASRWVAVVRSDHLQHPGLLPALRANGRPMETIEVAQLTEGQACTCLLAAEKLPPDVPLLIAPCDTAMVYDEWRYAALTAEPNLDCVVWTFRNHPHANRNPKQYGWCRTAADGTVLEVKCKEAFGPDVSRDPGIIGAFWFRRAGHFVELTRELIRLNRRVNNEFYADSVVQLLVETGGRAKVFDVKHYVCFGTPDDVKTYEYWDAYFRTAWHHTYGK